MVNFQVSHVFWQLGPHRTVMIWGTIWKKPQNCLPGMETGRIYPLVSVPLVKDCSHRLLILRFSLHMSVWQISTGFLGPVLMRPRKKVLDT